MKSALSPKKLLHSKWTAVQPLNKEKHFIVTDVEYAEDQSVEVCCLQAVLTKREQQIDWRTLRDSTLWKPGWI